MPSSGNQQATKDKVTFHHLKSAAHDSAYTRNSLFLYRGQRGNPRRLRRPSRALLAEACCAKAHVDIVEPVMAATGQSKEANPPHPLSRQWHRM